jgi:hypothetical protein
MTSGVVDRAALRAECVRFRAAIVAADLAKTSLCRFPRGSCSDASILLGQHLSACGFGDWEEVSGERWAGRDCFSHAWLEQDGLIVDITADQFQGIDTAVIVTTESKFHRSFKEDRRNAARIGIWDDHTQRSLRLMYSTICNALRYVR